MKVILLYSGGLDSTVLLYWLRESGNEVECLGFDYGQRHRRELNAAYMICEKLKVPFKSVDLDLSFAGSLIGKFRRGGIRPAPPPAEEMIGAPTVVAGRNLLFLSCALNHALGRRFDAIAIGAHAGDAEVYADCREEFLAGFEQMARQTYAPTFEVIRPFITWAKSGIVLVGKKLRVPFEKTWSCYVGETMPCGTCGACVERAKVLGTHENQGMSFARPKVLGEVKC